MDKAQEQEYAEYLKKSSKKMIDLIDTDTEDCQKILLLIHEFVKSGYLENRARKGGVA